MDKRNIEIYNLLKEIVKNPKCELEYNNNYELLVAVILSAQCTDKRVNMVTKELFKIYPSVQSLADAELCDIEKIVKPCGFFKSKAQNIKNACVQIIEKYGGQVPSDISDLMSLSGVGRKTANVIRSEGFKIPAIAVDTHVKRVSGRLGLSASIDPHKIEEDLRIGFDEKYWSELHLLLIHFGRYVCKSRNPNCEDCKLKKYCKGAKTCF